MRDTLRACSTGLVFSVLLFLPELPEERHTQEQEGMALRRQQMELEPGLVRQSLSTRASLSSALVEPHRVILLLTTENLL